MEGSFCQLIEVYIELKGKQKCITNNEFDFFEKYKVIANIHAMI